VARNHRPPVRGREPMEDGYIDVSNHLGCVFAGKEAFASHFHQKGEDPKCGPDGCLAKGGCDARRHQGHADLWSGLKCRFLMTVSARHLLRRDGVFIRQTPVVATSSWSL